MAEKSKVDEEGVEEGEEEEFSKPEPPFTDSQQHSEDVKKLDQYIKNLQYKPKDPPVASRISEHLQKIRKKDIVDVASEFKLVLPKYKSIRMQNEAAKFGKNHITTEDLNEMMKQRMAEEQANAKFRQTRYESFLKTLSILERQCRECTMKDIVEKFATYLADRCIKNDYPAVKTQPYQHLAKGLVYNMMMSLGVNGNNCTKIDISLYETLANVLADLLLQTRYSMENVDAENYELPDVVPENKSLQRKCFEKRANRAARKNMKPRKPIMPSDGPYKLFMAMKDNCGRKFNEEM